MKNKPVLVVMAAGMGSRYGGLKQIDPVGVCGEAILDYSVYDAYEAGFRTCVIIIKEAIREDFMQTVGARLAHSPMEIRYAYQETHKLPAGYALPEGRVKPWGTGHAVLCGREAVGDAPFAVINADDYYGKSAYRVMYQTLSEMQDPYGYCMVGYELSKTVTEHGTVARGVCRMDENNYLLGITERTRIAKRPEGIAFTEDGETWTDLPADTTVSMNMFGFMPSFMQELADRFPAFLDRTLAENPLKGEYFLPGVVEPLLKEGIASMKVLNSPDKWYGVTYAADKPRVVAALQALTEEGKYPPEGLWSGK